MELFDKETIYGIVADGRYNRRKAALMQGAPLTREQRDWWDEAEIAKTAEEDERTARSERIDRVSGRRAPMSNAERARRHEDKFADITEQVLEARKGINWRRRRNAEKSLNAWIRAYCIGVFVDDPPPAPHGVKAVDEMDEAVGASRPYQILIARGGGKTSYTEACVAYAIATGKKRFCLISSINATQAQQILREITAIFTTDTFAQDYPDIAVPIILLDGHGRRAQRFRGRDTKVRLVTDETMLPTIIDQDGPSTASGACIRAKALGSVRGTKNGTQRPDLVVLDDLQTRDLAENEDRVQGVLNLIRGDVMGLAGKAKASIISTATPISAEDVTYHLSGDPAWKTTRFPAILKWPDEWAKDGHGLWGEYFRLFDEENANDQTHRRRGGSLALYRTNRKAMDAGADILNWGNYDSGGGQISGLQKLMDKYHEMGHGNFMAEYQMEPQRQAFAFEVSANLIMHRVRVGMPAQTVTPDTVFVAAATDINPAYGLTTAVVAFDVNLTAIVVAYKVFKVSIDGRLNDVAFNAAVTKALHAHAKEVAGIGLHIDMWGIDAGGRQFPSVTKFAPMVRATYGIDATAMLGRAGQNWNPFVRSRIRAALNDTVTCRDERGRRWIAFNADSYKEKAQRAWGTEVGGDGGLSLFDGGVNHAKFAVQIANEKLVEKVQLKNRNGAGEETFAYRWKTKNPHDFGDCMAMCYALAGSRNITGDGRIRAAAGDGLTAGGRRKRKVYDGD